MVFKSRKDKVLIINDQKYEVVITYKPLKKTITYRFRDGKFVVSAPTFCPFTEIEKGLVKFAPRLLKASNKPSPYFDDKVYIFGYIYSLEDGEVTFPNGKTILFESKEQFEKKLKKVFLEVVIELVRINEIKMKIPPNNVKVRKMKTRYGSNSKKTKTITIAFELVHYELDIVNAIVIHELAHCLVFDHSKKFYDVVHRYCPNYKELHKSLRKGEFRR